MTAFPVPRVAVVAFDGISPFHLSVPCLVFGEEEDDAGAARYRVTVCAESPGLLRTNAGFSLQVMRGLGALRGAHMVVVPSWSPSLPPASPALLRALQVAHARGTRIVGLCLGAFVLAEAGLLDGRRATTHWQGVAAFGERHPQVVLQPEVLYVDEGDVVTSAGTAAGLDCCLHLLRSEQGAEAANRAARRLIVAPHRQGGQAQYIEQPVPPTPQRDRLSPLLQWLGARLHQPHAIDDLARRAAMSRRHFTRRFREVTGSSVNDWLQHQRVLLAQRLLESGDLPIEAVAARAGFGSAVSLRQHFAARLGVAPTTYRRQFRQG
jgi:transcriptional regulator GlxA family with amidase domain